MTSETTIWQEDNGSGRTIADVLIRSRDALRDRVLGIAGGRVLNDSPVENQAKHGIRVAAELKRTGASFATRNLAYGRIPLID